MRACRIVRHAGGEVGHAGAGGAVQPQAREQAVGIAAVTDAAAAVAEQVVAAAAAIPAGQHLGRQAVGAEETAARRRKLPRQADISKVERLAG